MSWSWYNPVSWVRMDKQSRLNRERNKEIAATEHIRKILEAEEQETERAKVALLEFESAAAGQNEEDKFVKFQVFQAELRKLTQLQRIVAKLDKSKLKGTLFKELRDLKRAA